MKKPIPKNREYFVEKVKELAKISILNDISNKQYYSFSCPNVLRNELEKFGILDEDDIHEDFRSIFIEERNKAIIDKKAKEIFYKNFFNTFITCWLFITSFAVLWFGISYFIVNDWYTYIHDMTIKMSYILPICAIITAMGTLFYAWEMYYNLNKWNENNGK